ncbi:MAG: FAD-linked oxidase C-terminal domain-containing protein [Anaerolineae bacterium]|nr:FAD-binding protein [Candidatus Roseilinea sp.]MDW8449733.1 FAD-linked oxidase C-terminal domain-containing protein [Anaerolineae bacterium]
MPSPAHDHPLAQALARHIAGEVRFDIPTRLIYSTDASNYQMMPLGVVLPKTTDDVIATVTLCAEHSVPITPRGGGSSLCGSSIGPGVVVDFTKYMDALLDLDASGRVVRVQPGLVLGQLNKRLAQHGLQFGPDPASAERAAIGGVIGANATGSHSIRYGMTADNVTALKVVLADGSLAEFGSQDRDKGIEGQGDKGTRGPGDGHSVSIPLAERVQEIVRAHEDAIRRDFPKVWRRASGYNLDYVAEMLAYDPAHPAACLTEANARRQGSNLENHLRQISQLNLAPLFAGAEGTLGVVVEATLYLFPKPKHTALVITAFDGLVEAMRAVPVLLTTEPSAIELIGGMFIRTARELPECRGRIGWLDGQATPEGLLVIEFDGESAAEARAGVERLQQLVARERLPCALRPLFDPAAQADVWYVRKIGLNVLTSIRSQTKPVSVVEDVAVPVERLAEYVERLSAIFAAHGTAGAFYAHASAGVLHVRPLVNLRTAHGVAQLKGIARDALALCRDLGGAMSGEHGDGYERSHQNEALFGPHVYQAFCKLKDAFDPRGLLNPGKKVRAVEMESHLRYGPAYATRPLQTTFAFRHNGSFAALVEQCNGSGVCRKLDGGVMCPSYRATREEMHSTRGRANLLREFLSERRLEIGDWRFDQSPISNLPISDLQSLKPSPEDVKAALDLCLSCKACATECAAGVDMSKLKSEFLSHFYDARGVPLRAWLLGRIASLAPAASLFAPVSNWLVNRALAKRLLRIAPERALPAFQRRTFDRWWARSARARRSDVSRPRVALFVDTFSRYNHPQVAIAAVKVLEAAGCQVIVPPWRCCGRPLLSQGQPKAMLAWARFNLEQLAPLARQGVPILGLEPSCISALKDDYPDLLPGEDADAVAQMTQSVEEFLISHLSSFIEATHDQSKTKDERSKILLHGHCHQKALWGMQATRALLTSAGYDVCEVDATCCGMAGAFGYEAEHYDLSRQIGELALLPAVRAASAETLIVAPGTSCREQILHFTGRAALHPVEVIARHLS